MSTTMAASGGKAVASGVSSVQDIPLENIRESTSNPRRVFDEAQLRELASNIQSHGVLQAILVRPSPDGVDGMYELVAGARRFRASKLAGKNTIPATVRNLTDAEAHELRLIENLQRTNIHELDEGIGYRSLMALRPDFYRANSVLRWQGHRCSCTCDRETSVEGPRKGSHGVFSRPSEHRLDPKGSQGRGADGPATPRVDRARDSP